MQERANLRSRHWLKMQKSSPDPTKPHTCEFCKRGFHDEMNLINHSCEKKRRWFGKEEPPARLAFMAWARFYELNSQLTKSGAKKRSFKEFMESKYYLAFMRFGKQMVDLNALEPARFIDYVIKNNLPLDKWIHDIVYENYVADLVKNEQPEAALARNIELMQQWSQQTGEPWQDFFRKVSPIQAAAWIKNGRISPWVLYNADSAVDLLDRCGPEQLQIIKNSAKVPQWKIRFNKNKDSADWIRDTLRQAGL